MALVQFERANAHGESSGEPWCHHAWCHTVTTACPARLAPRLAARQGGGHVVHTLGV